MLTDVEISNLAISHLGISRTIASLTEQSKEASMCSRFLDITRRAVLRDYKWPFATKIANLAEVETDPNDEWAVSYRYPSDCLMVRRILNGFPVGFLSELNYNLVLNFSTDWKIPYKIAQDSEGKLIWCSLDEAQLEYTVDTQHGLITPDEFDIVVSYRLAAFVAPSLTAGDPNKLGDKAMQAYLYEASKATANAYNEEQSSGSDDSALTRVRL